MRSKISKQMQLNAAVAIDWKNNAFAFLRTDRPAPAVPCGAACLPCRPPALPLACFVAPVPPAPFPAGRGSPKVYFAGGEAPGTPALNRLRHLQNLPSGCPAHGSLRFGAKPKEPPFHGQCRQPRRGGTGGDGTIRRKRWRRLRWSSPPGQGEQVPLGFSPPSGTTAARSAGDQPGKSPLGEWFAPAPSAAWAQPQGCKGRSPLHEITINLPFPIGEGAGG